MSKPLSKTARRYNSSNEQNLETLITMYDNAVRAGNLERAAAKRVEIDAVVSTTLIGGTNVIYGGARTSTATITASDTIDSADIRKAVAKLRANKAKARRGSYYWCGIHPEVSHDLRAETGNMGWNFVHAQTAPAADKIWAGEIGDYEGAFFVESSRIPSAKDGADQSALATTTPSLACVSESWLRSNQQQHMVLAQVSGARGKRSWWPRSTRLLAGVTEIESTADFP